MNLVCKKDMCTGCNACYNICPKKCININKSIKAYNAYINKEQCISCNLCKNVCQVNSPSYLSKTIYSKQGWADDNKIRTKSASGGIASLIIKDCIKKGIEVITCQFYKGRFEYNFVNDQNYDRFPGSKYVKSDPGMIYSEIKKLLIARKKVVFIGLPCHVGALKKFLTLDLQTNLITIDLICHGTPSPLIFSKYIKEHDIHLSEIKDVSFRNRNKFQISCNKKSVTFNGDYDPYSILFLNTVCFTENCYSCQYATNDRVSDITLGDSWGSDLPTEDINKGINLILCQSEKGVQLIESINAKLFDVNLDHAIQNNGQLSSPSKTVKHKRELFLRLINKKSINYISWRLFPYIKIRQEIKKTIYTLKRKGDR